MKYGIFKVDTARILFWSAPMIHEWTVASALPLRVCAMLQSREAMQKGSMLVWNTAGRPEPAGAPAFADVTDPDMAKAAQWCTEQGTMGAKGDRFEPEGWTPKFKVIEVWNKAFPAA